MSYSYGISFFLSYFYCLSELLMYIGDLMFIIYKYIFCHIGITEGMCYFTYFRSSGSTTVHKNKSLSTQETIKHLHCFIVTCKCRTRMIIDITCCGKKFSYLFDPGFHFLFSIRYFQCPILLVIGFT